MSDAGRAVFLSYASQDAEAANRICDALRQAGVEVWFDQNELVGGDAWDAKIRKQIAECALFVPVISTATQARREGYFRIEWRLAAQRTHAMSDDTTFLLPVVIDDTRDAEAKVPAEFKAVQWTRLRQGYGGQAPDDATEKFCERVKKLLGAESSAVLPPASGASERGLKPRATSEPASARRRVPVAAWASVVAVALAIIAFVVLPKLGRLKTEPNAGAGTRPPTAEKPAAPLSAARQLAEKANTMSLKKYNSTADDFAAAEGLLKEALALDQNDAEVWAISSLFNTAIRTRGFDNSPTRREAARSQAERALKLDPNSVEGLFALGRWQRDHEPDPAVAEKTFQAVLARSPDHEQAIGNLATLYDRTDRFEEAIAMFERAARNPRTMPLARYGQYLAYFNRWHFDEAERCLRESITAEPSANSVTGLAMVLLTGKGDAPAAVRALADMPAANRNEHRAVWISAFAHLAAREPEAALTALRRLPADFVQDNWFVGPTAYWVGRAHALAGRAEAARIAFESGLAVMDAKLKAAPGNSALHVARGELLAWLGRPGEALSEARTAAELASGRDLLAWYVSPVRIYAALGRADEALPLLEKFCARGVNRVGWPLTPALLKIDPLWDKLRGDARFQALATEAKPVGKQSAVTPAIDQKSVAVLAFKNLSGDPAREFFSDGLSEAVTDVLGRVPGLKVVGSASAFSFKGKSVPIPEIARQLGVSHLVEGTVLQEGSTVRITAKLIKADGFQVWVSDKLDRELKNIFALHDEVAGLIAKNLSLKLGASSAASKAPVNPEAFELYVQARQEWNQRTPAGFERAEGFLTRALALEPKFARAHAALADVWMTRLARTSPGGEAEGQRNSAEHARIRAKITEALTLDPDSAESHASLGGLLFVAGRNSEAESALRRAVALNPNYASARLWLGRLLLNLAYMSEALEHLKLATELDPLTPINWDNYGSALRYAGRPAEGITAYDRAIALQPNNYRQLGSKSAALVELGRVAEAVALVRQLPGNNAVTAGAQFFVFARAGLKAEAEALLADPRSAVSGSAENLLALGRTEEALALMSPKWLNLFYARHYLWNPIYDTVRNDPRWVKLMADAGLTEAHARAQAWRAAHPVEKAAAR